MILLYRKHQKMIQYHQWMLEDQGQLLYSWRSLSKQHAYKHVTLLMKNKIYEIKLHFNALLVQSTFYNIKE
jgi:hypothetical protein